MTEIVLGIQYINQPSCTISGRSPLRRITRNQIRGYDTPSQEHPLTTSVYQICLIKSNAAICDVLKLFYNDFSPVIIFTDIHMFRILRQHSRRDIRPFNQCYIICNRMRQPDFGQFGRIIHTIQIKM